jgi:hypothetical protein
VEVAKALGDAGVDGERGAPVPHLGRDDDVPRAQGRIDGAARSHEDEGLGRRPAAELARARGERLDPQRG